jgi:4-cresol dehydrogenase (hydroxylating) flavoprotein subunit
METQTSSTPQYAAAIAAWRALLGPDGADAGDATLGLYARTTQHQGTTPCCILYPRTTEEVQAVVRIAGQHRAPLHPISRGKNWGYGDRCAAVNGAAIVDLSRMDRILEVNTELAYTVIEPGVSQQALFDYLQDNQTGLWIDCTGAGPDSSIVGNTLDRGFGHTRYGDHFLTACGMEVVLPDGEVLRTGFGHFPQAKTAHLYRYGVGPFLDGLFCQSNLGIVTKLGLWLQPAPEAFTFFFIRCEDEADLPALVDRLRPLRLSGLLQSAVHIGNDLRILSGTGRYPWEAAKDETPLPPAVRRELRRASGLGAWNAGGSLAGTKGQVRAARKALRAAVKGAGRITFVNDRLIRLGDMAAKLLGRTRPGTLLQRRLAALKPNYGLLKGVPTDEPLLGAQWRLKRPPDGGPGDPLDSGCGLMWISPVVPMTGRDAKAVMAIVEPIFARHGFDPLATFTLINERAMIGILNVAFDKSDADETARAVVCYEELFEAVFSNGYIPYRVGLHGLPKLSAQPDAFWDLTVRIKHALDPLNIISPGRYIPDRPD